MGNAATERKKRQLKRKRAQKREASRGDPDTRPDWTGQCENCGASPVVPLTGMCGPCTFGEADTMGGNW